MSIYTTPYYEYYLAVKINEVLNKHNMDAP